MENGTDSYIIENIDKCSMKLRLVSMGLVPGSRMDIIRNTIGNSTVYINVEGKNYGLSQSVIKEMVLRPLSPEE